jgi:hypothetical protein
MSSTYKEFLLASFIVLLFAGGVVGYLWSQQPDDLELTTEIMKKPNYRIGIIPKFEPLDSESFSYYEVSVNTGQPHSNDEISYSTTETPNMTPEKAFWFENQRAPNDCAKITTTVQAYGDDDQLIAEGQSFDCVTGVDKFSQLSEKERQNLYPEAESIDVSLKRYQRPEYDMNGVVVSWSDNLQNEVDAYKIYTSDDPKSASFPPPSNPSSVFLDLPTKDSGTDCLENTVIVEALNKNDRVIGYGYSSECNATNN